MISRSSVTGTFSTKRLGEVVEFLDSMRRPVTESERHAGPYPYYGANGQQGTIDDFIFDEPLVLLAEDGGQFENPSRGIAYRVSGKTWVNNHAHVLRPNAEMDLGFLFRALENYDVTPWVTGTTRGKLTQGGAAQIILPVPPLSEQRRIAEILDKAEALRAKRRAALAKLDTLTQSIFLDMFGDPRQDATRWPKARIESLVFDMRGGTSLAPADFVDEGFPILHKGAIKPKGKISIDPKKKTFATREYAHANRKSQVNREFMAVTLRDLVPSGPSIGLVADLRKGMFEEYLLAQGAYGFRLNLNKILPEYLVQLSNMPNFRHVLRQNAVGSTQIHIRTPIFLRISIPLPPIELQRDFVHHMESIERIEVVQHASDADFDVLFESLQQRAFRGQL